MTDPRIGSCEWATPHPGRGRVRCVEPWWGVGEGRSGCADPSNAREKRMPTAKATPRVDRAASARSQRPPSAGHPMALRVRPGPRGDNACCPEDRALFGWMQVEAQMAVSTWLAQPLAEPHEWAALAQRGQLQGPPHQHGLVPSNRGGSAASARRASPQPPCASLGHATFTAVPSSGSRARRLCSGSTRVPLAPRQTRGVRRPSLGVVGVLQRG